MRGVLYGRTHNTLGAVTAIFAMLIDAGDAAGATLLMLAPLLLLGWRLLEELPSQTRIVQILMHFSVTCRTIFRPIEAA